MDKCNFCEREREKVDFLIAGETGFICNDCAEQAYKIVQENTEIEEAPSKQADQEFPINKTARAVAYNREVKLNIFENLYVIETERSFCSSGAERKRSVEDKHQLSPETFCLLVKLLTESVKEFGIDYEAKLEELLQGRKLNISFANLNE